jgi:hypothetical protein
VVRIHAGEPNPESVAAGSGGYRIESHLLT